MNEIVPAFESSVFDPTLLDAGIDVVEVGIDAVLNNDIIGEVPIAKTLIGLCKTGQNIRERNLLRQTMQFIIAFNDGTIDRGVLEAHRRELEENPKRAEEELGRILVILDRIEDLRKSKILGKLYRAYVSGELSWDKYCELADVTNRVFVGDLDLMVDIYENRVTSFGGVEGYRSSRLHSLGLLNRSIHSMTTSMDTSYFVSCTELGSTFVRVGILG